MVLFLLACTAGSEDSEVVEGIPAVFAGTCSPTDGLALEIRIGVDQPTCDGVFSGEHFRLAFWENSYPPTELDYSFDQSAADGMGTFFLNTSDSTGFNLVHGNIHVTVLEDGSWNGTFAVQQEDAAVQIGRAHV